MERKSVKMMPGRILVRRKDPDKVTEGGIVIPDVSKKTLNEGTVVEAGLPQEESWSPDAPKVQKGDYILFAPMGGVDVQINGEDLLVISHHDVFMVLE